MSERPNILCPCCQGQGVIELPDVLWSVLEIVRAAGPTGISAAEVHAQILAQRDIVIVTAVNNRLKALCKLGLVEVFSKYGKTLIWVATE